MNGQTLTLIIIKNCKKKKKLHSKIAPFSQATRFKLSKREGHSIEVLIHGNI